MNLVTGTDIDGQVWGDPPSIGCDEWQPVPIVSPAALQLTNSPVGFFVSVAAGQDPFGYWWTRDGTTLQDDGHYSGTHTPVLAANGINSLDAGGYQLIASNAFGMATSAVAQLVVHYVDSASSSSAPPYLTWANAATNIQDAIDAAFGGEVVLVTNGVYANGGRVMSADLTN